MRLFRRTISLTSAAVCAVTLLLCACGDSGHTVYSRFTDVNPRKWNNTEYCVFPLSDAPAHTFADSLTRYDVILTVRHNTDFPYNNLWIALDRTYGLDSVVTEKVNLRLADASGSWSGHAMQGLYEFSDTVMRRTRFSADDVIALRHDMPQTSVPGIVDIGVTLVKSR